MDHIIDNAKNSLTEAILATSIAEETHEILLVHANLTFMIRREVMLANHLQIISANTASTELVNTSGANQGIEELVPHLDYQAARLRKMVDLLQSVIGKISTFAAAEESLERVKVNAWIAAVECIVCAAMMVVYFAASSEFSEP